MERVRGIGGVFFKARDPEALAAWYARALGVPVDEWGGSFFAWADADGGDGAGTVWAPFPEDTGHFAPSSQPFMVNFVVRDLEAMLAQARAAGAEVDETISDDGVSGRFGWLMDPEGNRVELWQPPGRAPEA